MALPKIAHPTFTMIQPSTEKQVVFRPFLVAEEKILLIAQQSGDDADVIRSIRQVLCNVIQDPTFNPKSLTTFDLEYMFLKLRSKSVSNMVELSYIDGEDNKRYDFKVDLDTIEVTRPKLGEFGNKVNINKDVGMLLRWPTVDTVTNLPEGASEFEITDALLKGCIASVYDEDNIYVADEQTDEELQSFIDNLSTSAYEQIREYLTLVPKLVYTIEYKNSLGNDRKIILESLKDFFPWG